MWMMYGLWIVFFFYGRSLISQRLLNDLSTQCLSLIKELGISPSARAKLRIAKVETSDDLDDFMNEND